MPTTIVPAELANELRNRWQIEPNFIDALRSQDVEPQRLTTARFDSPVSERSRFASSSIKLIYAQLDLQVCQVERHFTPLDIIGRRMIGGSQPIERVEAAGQVVGHVLVKLSFARLIRDRHRLCLGEELFCTEHGQIEVSYPPVRGGRIQRSISAVFQRIAYELRFLFIPGGLIGGILLRTLKRTEKIQL